MVRQCPTCGFGNDASRGSLCFQCGAPLDGAPLSRRLGNWTVVRKIGQGGIGSVFEVIHPYTGQHGAAKVLEPGMAADRELVRRWELEVKVLARLSHPNIVQLLDAGTAEDGSPYFVTALLTNHRQLSAHLESQPYRALPVREAVWIAVEVLRALTHAHRAGVVHRDIKPANILIGCEDPPDVKLLDFGIARLLDTGDDDAISHSDQIIGTPLYMAPEQFQGRGISVRTDLYAVGVVLYQMLSGRTPFHMVAGHVMTLARQVMSADVPPLEGRVDRVPPDVGRIVHALLAKVPDHRPASADAVIAALTSSLPRHTGSWNRTLAGGDGMAAPHDARVGSGSDDASTDPGVRESPSPVRDGPSARRDRPRRLGAWVRLAGFVRRVFSGPARSPRAPDHRAPNPPTLRELVETDPWEPAPHRDDDTQRLNRSPLVRHRVLGTLAMIEVPVSSDPVLRQATTARFRAGYLAVAVVDDPNLVQVLDLRSGPDGSVRAVTRPPCNQSLDDRLRFGTIVLRDSLAVLHAGAAGLSALHAAGVVHGAVGPHAIRFGSRGPSLGDFRLARRCYARAADQREGELIGDRATTAPEVLAGGVPDAPADVFALGVIGRRCLQQPGHEADPRLAALIHAMTSHDPAGRPTASDIVHALQSRDRPADPASPAPSGLPVDRLAAPGADPTVALTRRLERLGFVDLAARGRSHDGLRRFSARDARGPVALYLVEPDERHIDQTARCDAMRWLVQHRPPLFVPFEAEMPLDDGTRVFVRRDPVPPPLPLGRPIAWEPAVAIAVVVLRALHDLREHGRRFDAFSARMVRAAFDDPASFACLLQPPLQYERGEQEVTTMAGGEMRGDPEYFSPGQLQGRDSADDSTYAAAVLLYSLLAGQTPLHGIRSVFELSARKVSEDPPKLAVEGVPGGLAARVDALVARDPAHRTRPVDSIVRDLLDCLGRSPWGRAARDHLERAHLPDIEEAPVPGPGPGPEPDPPGRDVSPAGLKPTLSPGQRVQAWTVAEFLRFGGEAELYRVRGAGGRPGILKLWYEGKVDPYSEGWGAYRASITACASLPGFPAVFDAEVLARRTPRPYIVLEEIAAPTWKERCTAGNRPDGPALLGLGVRLLEALARAHRHFPAVGDLSPANVLLRDAGGLEEPVLLDVWRPDRPPAGGRPFGTPGYFAPEVLNGASPAVRSDLFAAGVLLLEMALGRRVYDRFVERLAIPVDGFEEPLTRALRAVRDQVGADVAQALAPLVAVDPDGRPVDGEAAATRLRDAASRLQIRSTVAGQAGSSSHLGLERRLLRPIAQTLRTWRTHSDPRERIHAGLKLGELTARFLGHVLAADYLSSDARDEDAEDCLGLLTRPVTFGDVVRVVRVMSRALAARTTPPFMPELVRACTADKGLLPTLNALVPIRNRVTHRNYAMIPAGDVPSLHATVGRLVEALLGGVRFLATYAIVVPQEQLGRRDGLTSVRILDLQGCPVDVDSRPLVARGSMPADAVILCNADFTERLLLDPFIAAAPCDRCSAAIHVWFSEGQDDSGKVRYSDPITAHMRTVMARDESGRETAMKALLAHRAQLGLRGPLDVPIEAARAYWGMDLPIRSGQELGPVVVQEEIGRGSMGVVFKARDPALCGDRAVKVVRPDMLGGDRTAWQQLQREGRRLEKLRNHPRIVQVVAYGVTPDESACYLVMELLPNGSLDDRLRRRPAPTLAEVRRVREQLLDALAFLAENDIVHRDIKPSNVLLAGPDDVKLADFGVARDLRSAGSASVGFRGSLLYAAPEQLSRGPIGPPTDLYALGLLLFDLVVGRPADQDPARRAALIRHAASALRVGDRIPELSHHDAEAELAQFLDDLTCMTDPVPERRRPRVRPPGAAH